MEEQEVPLFMTLETMTLTDFLDSPFECDCGKSHTSDIKTVEIASGALSKLPELIRKLGHEKAFVVADSNTYGVAGRKVLEYLQASGIPHEYFLFETLEVVPDEAAIGSLLMHFDTACDLVIGIGTGTINDMCRFISHRMGRSYFIVATAPSMDGFASTVAPLITNNLKTTYEAHTPEAIIADLDILADAPMPMIAAGFGDILGKSTCLCDWRLSSIINGEYYCETIASMMELALQRTIACKDGLINRDKTAIGQLTEALILAGIAMSYAGNSRPASGSEHHLSHFWEMRYLFAGRKAVLHGAKVGIGTVIVLKLYEYLRNAHLDFEKIEASPTPAMDAGWRQEIERVFGPAAKEIILLEEKAGKNSPQQRQQRIGSIRKHWKEIQDVINTLPTASEAEELLLDTKGPSRPQAVGLTENTVKESVIYAKEVRNRYTILQLLWDLNLLEPYADRVAEFLYRD
ncbi:MAG: sn-glycerol-1-phosphate dehydrogenase [Firmicutes bacterium]|nr:sn-glycerol-1-phosphate dehydrogenase [Bacillota bacterium]